MVVLSFHSVERLIRRGSGSKKAKQYRVAVKEYSTRLQEAFARDSQRELDKMQATQVDIVVGEQYTELKGFTVANLPEVKVNESVRLLKPDTKQQVARGSVISAGPKGLKVRLRKPITVSGDAPEKDRVFRLSFGGKHIQARRERLDEALRKFATISRLLPIHKTLLGSYNELLNTKYQQARVFCPDKTIDLERSQKLAIEHAMKKRICLIEGVAGSGKSLVAASVAYSMKRFRDKKVLLCSPMQATVDKLARMLAEDGRVNVVKLTSERRNRLRRKEFDERKVMTIPEIPGNQQLRVGDDTCALETLVDDAIFTRRCKRSVGKRPRYVSTARYLHHSRQQAVVRRHADRLVNIASPWLRRQEERKVLGKADIVCCTLVQAGSEQLGGFSFDMLIIDDAHAAIEADCIIAMMVKGLKQVTLISDMRRGIRLARSSTANNKLASIEEKPAATKVPPQKSRRSNTGPYLSRGRKLLKSRETNGLNKETKTNNSATMNNYHSQPGGLFERWLSIGLTAFALKYQFRMHKTLAALPNHHFYLSQLKTKRVVSDGLNREIVSDLVLGDDSFSWLPNKKCLTALFVRPKDSSSVEDTTQEIIDLLIEKENVHKSRIGILTNNRADTTIPRANFEDVCIGTVEDYFGQEKDFVVLSCKNFESIDNEMIDDEKPVSLEAIKCNFLKSDTALLIALTRARLGLFIVADESICLKDETVENCQTLCDENGVVDEKQQDSKFCHSWKALVSYYRNNKLVS